MEEINNQAYLVKGREERYGRSELCMSLFSSSDTFSKEYIDSKIADRNKKFENIENKNRPVARTKEELKKWLKELGEEIKAKDEIKNRPFGAFLDPEDDEEMGIEGQEEALANADIVKKLRDIQKKLIPDEVVYKYNEKFDFSNVLRNGYEVSEKYSELSKNPEEFLDKGNGPTVVMYNKENKNGMPCVTIEDLTQYLVCESLIREYKKPDCKLDVSENAVSEEQIRKTALLVDNKHYDYGRLEIWTKLSYGKAFQKSDLNKLINREFAKSGQYQQDKPKVEKEQKKAFADVKAQKKENNVKEKDVKENKDFAPHL